jgi:formyl-CoA transferase
MQYYTLVARARQLGNQSGPLAGVRVLELGNFIAGPFAGQLLGDLGAEIIKVEAPGEGDPIRHWGTLLDGDSLWWPSIARNKLSVAVDLRDGRGQDVVRRLMQRSHIVIENFRPGRLREWGMDYESIAPSNPGLVLVHVSGFGQTGPRARDAGFGSIGEAVGGIRFTTGEPGLPPSRTGISLGDALAALFAAVGGLAAWTESVVTGRGQEVDVAIYEAVAALMESSMADYELGGVLRTRSGSILRGVAPSNSYCTKDGSEVVIAANADAVFARLTNAMEQPELATDQRFSSHIARGENMNILDRLINTWTSQFTAEELLAILEARGVPAGRIFTAADMLRDSHYAAREMVLRRTSAQGWTVPMPGIVPKLSRTPGSVRTPGPPLGADTSRVLRGILQLTPEEYGELLDSRVISEGPEARAAEGNEQGSPEADVPRQPGPIERVVDGI